MENIKNNDIKLLNDYKNVSYTFACM